MKVVVIGGGVIGLSTAVALAERDAEVSVVEADRIGAGTSSTSYAWANANGKEPENYFEINHRGLQAHHALLEQVGAPWFVAGGHLEVASDPAHAQDLERRVERLQSLGYEAHWLTSEEAVALYPDLRLPDPVLRIAHYPREGHIFPAMYLAWLRRRCVEVGVTTLEGQPVVALQDGEQPRVDLADGTVLDADHVVIAAGRWSGTVAALAGGDVPVIDYLEPGDITVGYLFETTAVPVHLPGLLTSPNLNVRPDGGGRLLLQALDLDVTADPTNGDGPAVEVREEVLRRLNATLSGAERAAVSRTVVGQRVIPNDGRTIAGPVPGLQSVYAVATHSGMTLAPFLGPAVAEEVLGTQVEVLEGFRPARFSDPEALPTPYSPRKPGEQ